MIQSRVTQWLQLSLAATSLAWLAISSIAYTNNASGADCNNPGCLKKCAPISHLIVNSTQYKVWTPATHSEQYCANMDLIMPGHADDFGPGNIKEYINGTTVQTCSKDGLPGPGAGNGGTKAYDEPTTIARDCWTSE